MSNVFKWIPFVDLTMLSRFSHVQLFVIPWTAARQAPLPWDSPVKNTGVDFHALLQGIFPAQGLDPSLLYCRQILGVTLEYMNSVPLL